MSLVHAIKCGFSQGGMSGVRKQSSRGAREQEVEAVAVDDVPCSRGRRSTTAWPRGTVFSFCFFSFCSTSITVTRERKSEELVEFL